MRRVWWILGFLGFFEPALAEDPKISPGDVLQAITHDWNGDYSDDRAVLIANEDGADLFVYLSIEETDQRVLSLHAPRIAWRGIMAGTEPSLTLTKRGSLQVHSMNDSIGRNRWSETLTIAYRNGIFGVWGYTFEARDTLDLDYSYACDVNLGNGKGIFNGKAFQTPIRASQAERWSEGWRPPMDKLCSKDL